MSPKRRKTRLLLTQRALRDIGEIESYSLALWGKRTTAEYLESIEAALLRVRENPELLRADPDLHPELRFYRINKHVLVCDFRMPAVVVLTVIHSSRDIPSRLAEMLPTLTAEVEVLHSKLSRRD